jgi:hypothetical protein
VLEERGLAGAGRAHHVDGADLATAQVLAVVIGEVLIARQHRLFEGDGARAIFVMVMVMLVVSMRVVIMPVVIMVVMIMVVVIMPVSVVGPASASRAHSLHLHFPDEQLVPGGLVDLEARPVERRALRARFEREAHGVRHHRHLPADRQPHAHHAPFAQARVDRIEDAFGERDLVHRPYVERAPSLSS